MTTEDEVISENCNSNRDAAVSLIINSVPGDGSSGDQGSDSYSNNPCRQNEEPNKFMMLKQRLRDYFDILRDWWICTSIIKKVKLLALVVLPCLAIGLYLFYYPHHRHLLHNPIAVLHPFSVVHPVIPSPFLSTVQFIKEKSKDILFKSADVSVTTLKGPIVGRRFDPNTATGASYDAFLGIPYGHIPSRFQRAVPVSGWFSPRPTQSDGPACPQPDINFSEDCLFINVFTPKGAADATASYPVITFIHGSNFTKGSSSSKVYGPDFLVPKGIILVTFNYRLGATGFLTLASRETPGNMGLYDTQLALRWVQEEIRNFGGDPRQVTLMGQGAGSVLAMFHYLTPSSNGLFRYVIAQSGSALAGWGHYTPTEGAARAKALAAAVGCDSSSNVTQIITCLRQVNISYLVGNQSVPLSTQYEASGETMVFLPVLDTGFADKPFFNDTLNNLLDKTINRSKPMIMGFTADEGIIKFSEETWKIVETNLGSFIPPEIASSLSQRRKVAVINSIRNRYFQDSVTNSKILDIVRIVEDHMMIVPILQVAHKLANSSYGYVFNFSGPWTPNPPYIAKFHVSGVNHGFDLRYLFYASNDSQDLGNCSSLHNSLKVRDMMVNWWTNFVKTGTPGATWPKISSGSYLEINTNTTLINATTLENDHNFGFWTSLESISDVSSATFVKLNYFMVILVALFCILVPSTL